MALSCCKKTTGTINRNNVKTFHSFATNSKLEFPEKVCKKKKIYGIVLPTQKDNTLEFNQHMKLQEIWYIIYPDIERFIKKIDNCKNYPEKYSAAKIGKHIPGKHM